MSAFVRTAGDRCRAAAPRGAVAAYGSQLRRSTWQLRLGVLLLACAGWLAPAPAKAWAAFGHRLVALLAQEQLSDSTRTEVDLLLAQQSGADLGTIAAWPDEIRQRPGYERTGPFHYVNIKDAGCKYVATRDCPDGVCIVAALPRYLQTLGDRSQPSLLRLEALKFVVHLVGDVHQPLHAANRDDRGGNEFQINLNGEATNLHAVWDYHLLRSTDLGMSAYRRRLRPRVAASSSIESLGVAEWAQASCALIDHQSMYPRRPGKLPAAYLDQQRPLAEQQIALAAARLAAVLTQTLGTKEPADVSARAE